MITVQFTITVITQNKMIKLSLRMEEVRIVTHLMIKLPPSQIRLLVMYLKVFKSWRIIMKNNNNKTLKYKDGSH